MSASTWITRAKHRIDHHAPTTAPALRQWIGIDVSSEENPRRMQRLLPLLLIALIAALGVVSLRIDLIRVRYAMADALDQENSLIAEQRRLIVRRRQLRDPVELAVRARTLGFRPPSRVISVPEPSLPGASIALILASLPDVGAPPRATDAEDDWQ
jgi:hypothetical protein